MVQVDLLMYCFQASEPDSRPPPVDFSPPNAPPISAPEVGMFMLTIPQSDPLGPSHYNKAMLPGIASGEPHLENIAQIFSKYRGRQSLLHFVVDCYSVLHTGTLHQIDDGGECFPG